MTAGFDRGRMVKLKTILGGRSHAARRPVGNTDGLLTAAELAEMEAGTAAMEEVIAAEAEAAEHATAKAPPFEPVGPVRIWHGLPLSQQAELFGAYIERIRFRRNHIRRFGCSYGTRWARWCG